MTTLTLNHGTGFKQPVLRAYMYGDPQEAVDRKRAEDAKAEQARINKHRRIAHLTKKVMKNEKH